jgi:hypothetical protein
MNADGRGERRYDSCVDGIRNEYERDGVEGFYAARGAGYRNPHEGLIARAVGELVGACGLDVSRVLDLACGSGEVTLAVRAIGGTAEGVDPYTGEAFAGRTGQGCEAMTFEEVAAGGLAGRTYSLVACSFAMHLVEASRLPGLCRALGEVAPAMLILTPHKRPVIRAEWGWALAGERVWTSGAPEFLRCRGRVYSVVR